MTTPAETEHLRDLVARMAEEVEQLSRATCWVADFDHCANGGCVHRRALLDEARTLLASGGKPS